MKRLKDLVIGLGLTSIFLYLAGVLLMLGYQLAGMVHYVYPTCRTVWYYGVATWPYWALFTTHWRTNVLPYALSYCS